MCDHCAMLVESTLPTAQLFCGSCGRSLRCVRETCRFFFSSPQAFCPGCSAPQHPALPSRRILWQLLLEAAPNKTPVELLLQLRQLVDAGPRLSVFKGGESPNNDDFAVILRFAYVGGRARAARAVEALKWVMLDSQREAFRSCLRQLMECVCPSGTNSVPRAEPFNAGKVAEELQRWLEQHGLAGEWKILRQNLTVGRPWKKPPTMQLIDQPPKPKIDSEIRVWEIKLQLAYLRNSNYITKRKRARLVQRFVDNEEEESD